jgi:hypothetical protein
MILPCVHELRARAAEQAGDRVVAEDALRRAQQLFREMGAPLQVERLARALGL